MATRSLTAASDFEFVAYYSRPDGNKTGSFVVPEESDSAVLAYCSRHTVDNRWEHCAHPVTGARLKAFRPVEGRQLHHVEGTRGIRHGQKCLVRYEARPFGGRMVMKFLDVRPA